MKPVALFLLFSLALPAFAARALDPSIFDDTAPLTPALTQLFTDLEAIPAGASVTDARHAALVADLLALPPGPSRPEAADVDQLATDLGAAAVAGLITDDEEYTIASDVVVDTTDPDSWFTYLRDEVTYLVTPPDAGEPVDGTLPGDGIPWGGFPWDDTTFYPLETLFFTAARAEFSSEVVISRIVPLSAQYYKVAGETAAAYSGEVRLTSVRHPGFASATVVRVSTQGLPRAQRYQAIVTRATDGTKVSVGKFRVHGTGRIVDFADAQASGRATRETSSRVVFGAGSRPLAARLKVTKVSNVSVLDAAGRVRLSYDFDPASTAGIFVRRVHLTLQREASTATGVAVAMFKTRDGAAVRNGLRFSARGLPANAAVTLLADGASVGRYTTNAAGHLRISAADATLDFSQTKSVSLTDALGATLLTGSL